MDIPHYIYINIFMIAYMEKLIKLAFILTMVNSMSLANLAEIAYIAGAAILFASVFMIVMIWAVTEEIFSREQKILALNVVYSIAWLVLLIFVPLLLLGLIPLAFLMISVLLFIVPLLTFIRDYMRIKSVEREIIRLDNERMNLVTQLKNLNDQVTQVNEKVDKLVSYIDEAMKRYEDTKNDNGYFVEKIPMR